MCTKNQVVDHFTHMFMLGEVLLRCILEGINQFRFMLKVIWKDDLNG
jgi:hypothetical protein